MEIKAYEKFLNNTINIFEKNVIVDKISTNVHLIDFGSLWYDVVVSFFILHLYSPSNFEKFLNSEGVDFETLVRGVSRNIKKIYRKNGTNRESIVPSGFHSEILADLISVVYFKNNKFRNPRLLMDNPETNELLGIDLLHYSSSPSPKIIGSEAKLTTTRTNNILKELEFDVSKSKVKVSKRLLQLKDMHGDFANIDKNIDELLSDIYSQEYKYINDTELIIDDNINKFNFKVNVVCVYDKNNVDYVKDRIAEFHENYIENARVSYNLRVDVDTIVVVVEDIIDFVERLEETIINGD